MKGLMGNKYNIGVDDRAEWKSLEWTTTPPKEPGYYWTKDVDGDCGIMEVRKGGGWLLCGVEAYFDPEYFTHYLGPLPIPEPPKE